MGKRTKTIYSCDGAHPDGVCETTQPETDRWIGVIEVDSGPDSMVSIFALDSDEDATAEGERKYFSQHPVLCGVVGNTIVLHPHLRGTTTATNSH